MKNGDESNDYLESDGEKKNRTRRPILNERVERQIGRFGERLKEAIGEESVRTFGRRAGVSEGAIRQYLKGNRFPDLDILAAIADTAQVNFLWLATGEGPVRGEVVDPSTGYIGHVDLGLLKIALEIAEESVIFGNAQKKAEAAAGIYDFYAHTEGKADPVQVRRLVESFIRAGYG